MPPPSTQKTAPPSRPQWDVLPAPGSPRSPCQAPCKWAQCPCHYWFAIRAKPCGYCELPLGNVPCAILIWPSGNVAHQACQDEYLELEDLRFHDPDVVEAAVRKAKLTMQTFSQLPSWERQRLILPELDATCPDWQARIRQQLRINRNPTQNTN